MRYTMFTPVLALGLAVWAVTPAQAQLARDRVEKANDRAQIRQDNRALRDDLSDAARLQALLDRFDAARAGHDMAALARIDGELRTYLGSELGESKVGVARAGKEVRQDRREVRSDRREIQGNQIQDAPPVVRVDDRHDLRDDRRDRSDDRRDASAERRELAAKRRIAVRLHGLDGKYDESSLVARRAMIVDLVGLAGGEIRQDATEKHEDVRELREDRHETREDRRQGG
jgi:hypothetical protein